MTEEAAFLAAIAAAPADNAIRLVFADWLEERGCREAKLIRAECELTGQPVGYPQWHDTFSRYRIAGEGLSEQWCEAVGRFPLAHWLAVAARSAWTRLDRWFEVNHPRVLQTLNPGASPEEIEAVERSIGQTLPPDVRASLAIHNGGLQHPILGDDLLSTPQVIAEWREWRGLESYNEEFRWSMESFPEGAVALDYANSGWIPLTQGGSDYLGIDLAPGPSGSVGQVMNFGRDEEHKCVLASGWAEFLADLATFLESGAVSGFDPNSSNVDDWYSDAMDNTNCHDVLTRWRKEGRWPPREQSV